MSERQAACYRRVSSEDQAVEGFSMEAQKEACELLGKVKGDLPLELYSDPGWSGADTTRPNFQRLIRDIKSGKIGKVYIWRLDRLTRKLRDLESFLELIDETDTELISVCDSIDTRTASGRILPRFMGLISEYFLEVLSENVKAGMAKRAQEGKWNTVAPTGGAVVEGKLIWTDKAQQVITAFEMAAEDKTLAEISRTTGIRVNSLWYVLKNPCYCGKVRTTYGTFDGEHEPIISEELFNKVQEVKKPRGEGWKKRAPHPLSGFVRCGKCKRSMVVCYSGKGLQSYTCKHKNGEPCDGVSARSVAKIERALISGLQLLKESQVLRQELREYWISQEPPDLVKERIAKTERAIAEVQRKRKRISELLLEDGITEDDFREIKAELVQREKLLEKELEAFRDLKKENQRHLASLDELLVLLDKVSIEDIWTEASDIERKWILQDYVQALVVHKDYCEVQLYDVPAFRVDWSEVDGRWGHIRSLVERETGLEPAT